jgi:hypothetical protein
MSAEEEKKEEINPLQRTAGVPIFLLNVLKARAETMAPAFPHAAEIPWANPRNLVGNTTKDFVQ